MIRPWIGGDNGEKLGRTALRGIQEVESVEYDKWLCKAARCEKNTSLPNQGDQSLLILCCENTASRWRSASQEAYQEPTLHLDLELPSLYDCEKYMSIVWATQPMVFNYGRLSWLSHTHRSLGRLSVLFHWSSCLSLHQCHAVLIMTGAYEVLIRVRHTSPSCSSS